jgi:hypothetical protein
MEAQETRWEGRAGDEEGGKRRRRGGREAQETRREGSAGEDEEGGKRKRRRGAREAQDKTKREMTIGSALHLCGESQQYNIRSSRPPEITEGRSLQKASKVTAFDRSSSSADDSTVKKSVSKHDIA